MIDLAIKWSGLGWIIEAIDGYKTYIGAVSQILTGVAGSCVAIVNLLGEFQATHGASSMMDFAKTLSHDPNAAALAIAWATISHGFTAIGQRHAQEKLEALTSSSPAQANLQPAAAVPQAAAAAPAAAPASDSQPPH